jgi:hypothetical protein
MGVQVFVQDPAFISLGHMPLSRILKYSTIHQYSNSTLKCITRASGVAQEVERLPSKHEAMNSRPSTAKMYI